MTRDPLTEQRAVHGAVRALIIGIGLVVALSSFYVAPRLTNLSGSASQASNPSEQGTTSDTNPANPTPGGQAAASNAPGATVPGGGGTVAHGGNGGTVATACAPGKNGGATDVGVSGNKIRLAATEVESGIGSSFLGPVRFGILAVFQKINRQGGICGRQLDLTLKDDAWKPDIGKQYIDNWIDSNSYFALAVVPSSEGLNAASGGGDIDRAGIPVIGTDGMLNSQYTDPWIWPVAASTATSMRIMAHDAHARGATKFALVYNGSYKFGVEGAGAFKAQVARDHGTLDPSCIVKLDANNTSYQTQVSNFNQSCGNVDFVALLLEPQTAETWLQSSPYMGIRSDGSGYGAGGPQPLFDDNFGTACGETCANMRVWTSFYPPIFPYDQQAAVQQFKRDLCVVDGNCNADADSAFTEGGYVGAQLVVYAFQQVGPQLTRKAVKQFLDSATFDSKLSGPLTWRSGNHYANETMVAFRDTFGGQFTGFQIVNGSQQSDPCRACNDPSL